MWLVEAGVFSNNEIAQKASFIGSQPERNSKIRAETTAWNRVKGSTECCGNNNQRSITSILGDMEVFRGSDGGEGYNE